MFENALEQRFIRLQAEFNRKLYRYFTLCRELPKLEEDLNRIEAGLFELEQSKKDLEIAKAQEETQDSKKEK